MAHSFFQIFYKNKIYLVSAVSPWKRKIKLDRYILECLLKELKDFWPNVTLLFKFCETSLITFSLLVLLYMQQINAWRIGSLIPLTDQGSTSAPPHSIQGGWFFYSQSCKLNNTISCSLVSVNFSYDFLFSPSSHIKIILKWVTAFPCLIIW